MIVTSKVQKGRLLKWQEDRSFVCGKQTFFQDILPDLPCARGPDQNSEENHSEHGRQVHCGPGAQPSASQMLEFQSQRDIGACDIPHPHFRWGNHRPPLIPTLKSIHTAATGMVLRHELDHAVSCTTSSYTYHCIYIIKLNTKNAVKFKLLTRMCSLSLPTAYFLTPIWYPSPFHF